MEIPQFCLNALWVLIPLLATLRIVLSAFTVEQRRAHGQKVAWKCEYPGCRRQFHFGDRMELHHILPTSQGGQDTDDNIQCLCLEHHALIHEELAAEGRGHPDSPALVWARYEASHGGKTDKWLIAHGYQKTPDGTWVKPQREEVLYTETLQRVGK